MSLFLGERVEKTEDNKYGWNDKISLESIDATKPVIICLPGSSTINGFHSNGMCSSIERMLGTCPIKPCKIYGVYYGLPAGTGKYESLYFDSKANGENYDLASLPTRSQMVVQDIQLFSKQLVRSVFMPLVQDEKGQLYNPLEIARKFRNIHFVSFCFGSVVQSAINQELRQYLLSTGLDINTIEKLESQICNLQLAPIASETKTCQTTINFVSLGDEETINKPIEQKALYDYNQQSNQDIIGGISKSPNVNPTVYVKEFTTLPRDEEHSGGYYMHFLHEWINGGEKYEEQVGGILPLCAAVCLRRAMQNAVSNNRTARYVPLSSDDVVKPCAKFLDWANFHPQELPQSLLEVYNQHVDYENTNLIETLNQ